jgi:hypothetical protein
MVIYKKFIYYFVFLEEFELCIVDKKKV